MKAPSGILGGLAVTALVVVTGCGPSDGYGSGAQYGPPTSAASAPSSTGTAGSSAPAQAVAPAAITIKRFAFDVPATVAPGATITVTNRDNTAHTVTATGPGGFDVTVPAGASATFTAPAEAGSFAFHCVFHPDMTGKLIVK